MKKHVEIKPFRKFVTIAKSAYNLICLLKYVKKYKKEVSEIREKNLASVYIFHAALIKKWFVETFKTIWKSIINYDDSLDFSVGNIHDSDNESNRRAFNKTKIFITSLLNSLIKCTNK